MLSLPCHSSATPCHSLSLLCHSHFLPAGDKRKDSAGHVGVEKYLEASGLPFTVFQPQYIYGAHTAKDCEQWFVDRIIR